MNLGAALTGVEQLQVVQGIQSGGMEHSMINYIAAFISWACKPAGNMPPQAGPLLTQRCPPRRQADVRWCALPTQVPPISLTGMASPAFSNVARMQSARAPWIPSAVPWVHALWHARGVAQWPQRCMLPPICSGLCCGLWAAARLQACTHPLVLYTLVDPAKSCGRAELSCGTWLVPCRLLTRRAAQAHHGLFVNACVAA